MDKPLSAARALLQNVYLEALEAVRGQRLVEALGSPDGELWRIHHGGGVTEWRLPSDGRVIVIGAGKAAGSLALGLEKKLGDRIDDSCVIVKHGHRVPLTRIRQIEAGHPIPDEQGVQATAELLRTIDGLTERDSVIVLLTGGASALMVAPAGGISLAEKAAATDMLLRSGASIEEINCVRKCLSQVKGGRLLDRIGPASVLTLMISDIPSGDIGMVGSGPTIRNKGAQGDALDIFARYGLEDRVPRAIRTCLERQRQRRPSGDAGPAASILLADSGTLVQAVHDVAVGKGVAVRDLDTAMTGSTHDAALAMAVELRAIAAQDRPLLLVAAGETTLQVTGDGLGGRNQEYALVAALALEGEDNVALLAAGTDGTDGPTNAAGAFADGRLVVRASAVGLDPREMLARNDSHRLFAATGDLLTTGPTDTNVMDLVLGLAF